MKLRVTKESAVWDNSLTVRLFQGMFGLFLFSFSERPHPHLWPGPGCQTDGWEAGSWQGGHPGIHGYIQYMTQIWCHFHGNQLIPEVSYHICDFSSWGDWPSVLWDERWLVGPRLPHLWNDSWKASVPSPWRAPQHVGYGEKDPDRPGGIWRKVQRWGETNLFTGESMSRANQKSMKRKAARKTDFFLYNCSYWLKTQSTGWAAWVRRGERYSHIIFSRKSISGCWRQDLWNLHLNLMWVPAGLDGLLSELWGGQIIQE